MTAVTNSALATGHLTLAAVCRDNDTLRHFFQTGIGALKKADRQSVKVPDTTLLGASVALDDATRSCHPLANRWDYAIEYDGDTFFIEVHPASTSEIDCIINKVVFIKEWLRDNCPDFLKLPAKEAGPQCFYWVSSGSTDLRITPGSQQARKLALHRIKPVGKVWIYSKLFR